MDRPSLSVSFRSGQLHCDHVWSFVKPATNVTCLEFLQFFQVSLAASTNWRLKLNFYSISENKYNKFDSFSEENKKREVLKRKQEDGNDPKNREVSG